MLDFDRLWTHGKYEKTLIDGQESMRKLAAYITKTPKTTDGILLESNYSCSRNLPIPTPTVNVYLNKKTWGELVVPGEFYLEKSSSTLQCF